MVPVNPVDYRAIGILKPALIRPVWGIVEKAFQEIGRSELVSDSAGRLQVVPCAFEQADRLPVPVPGMPALCRSVVMVKFREIDHPVLVLQGFETQHPLHRTGTTCTFELDTDHDVRGQRSRRPFSLIDLFPWLTARVPKLSCRAFNASRLKSFQP